MSQNRRLPSQLSSVFSHSIARCVSVALCFYDSFGRPPILKTSRPSRLPSVKENHSNQTCCVFACLPGYLPAWLAARPAACVGSPGAAREIPYSGNIYYTTFAITLGEDKFCFEVENTHECTHLKGISCYYSWRRLACSHTSGCCLFSIVAVVVVVVVSVVGQVSQQFHLKI